MFARLARCLREMDAPTSVGEGCCSTLNPFSSGACLCATEHAAHPMPECFNFFLCCLTQMANKSSANSQRNSKEFHNLMRAESRECQGRGGGGATSIFTCTPKWVFIFINRFSRAQKTEPKKTFSDSKHKRKLRCGTKVFLLDFLSIFQS
jgi:hypothetical protein